MNAEATDSDKKSIASRSVKIAVFLLLLAFYGSFLVHKIALPFGDDLGRHITNGEMILSGNFDILYVNVYAYTETDFPFVNHHWLSGVVFYLVYQAVGLGGIIIFKTIILLVAFALLFFTALKKANFWLVAFFSLPTILLLSGRTHVRPEMFSFLFIAIFLYVLTDLEEHPERNKVFWLLPLELLWVNLHLFFVIGIMLVGGFLVEKIIVHRKNIRNNQLVKKLFITLFSLIAISFINPNGWRGALQPLQIFTNYGFTVSENLSIVQYLKIASPGDAVFITIFMLTALLLFTSFIFGLSKKPFFYFLAAVGTSVAGLLVMRTFSYLALIFLPAASANFNDLFCSARDRLTELIPARVNWAWKVSAILVVGVPLMFMLWEVEGKILVNKKPGIGLTEGTEHAAEFFKTNFLRGPIFNDYDIGSYLIYSLFPEEKVFIDNRPEAYSPSFFSDTYFPAMQEEDSWQEALKKYNFNVIFIDQYDHGWYIYPFLRRRLSDPEWSLVYADAYSMIFLRNTSENEKVIRQFHITPENAGEKLSHLTRSENIDEQIAAADVFNLLGRADLGETTFFNIVSRWPDEGKIWMLLGQLALLHKDRESALSATTYLEKSIALGWKTAEAYHFLGSAYLRLGQEEKAREALLQALAIDPERENTKKLLRLLGGEKVSGKE